MLPGLGDKSLPMEKLALSDETAIDWLTSVLLLSILLLDSVISAVSAFKY